MVDWVTAQVSSVATVLSLGLGLLYWFSFRTGRIDASPPTKAPLVCNERFTAFIEHEVGTHETVLFVSTESQSKPFQALFDVLHVPLHVVNLERIAGGTKVLQVLQQKLREQDEQEFLFVKGVLIGGLKQLRQLFLDGRKHELGIHCDWSHIRVDNKSDMCVMLLNEKNAFQCVRDAAMGSAIVETKPLYTIQELIRLDLTMFARCSVPLALRSREQHRRSKLMVCHDLKGGYLDDRFIYGSKDFNAYRFYQWDLVDVFVYFAHALVSPPPPGWIAAGHRHGTQVLGTFLTEGDKGTEQCKKLFHNFQSAEMYALKLAVIVRHGGFDGWLIQIENDVSADLVPKIDVFLCTLRKRMQIENPHALVVWYGTLSRTGKRSSNVRLDAASTEFFRNVDAFYTNYGWTPDDAKFSAAFDLDRRYDIYMGIDVVGRHNMIGGGKMNCGELLRVAWNSGVSSALFAPARTYECCQDSGEDFIAVENRFWNGVRKNWKVKSPCYDALGGVNCFYSAFNIGRGVGVWAKGKQLGTTTWSNMTELDLQPDQALHVNNVVSSAMGSVKAHISHDTAFQGGSSIAIQGNLAGREKIYFKLFDVDIKFIPRRVVEISYTTATQDDSVCLLVLTVCPGFDRATHYVILRSSDDSDSNESTMDCNKVLSANAKASADKHFYLPISTECFSLEAVHAEAALRITTDGWRTKTYRIGGQLWDQKHIVEIGVVCTKKESKAYQECDAFLAYVGEVCVMGNSNMTVHRNIHSPPQICVNARVTSYIRHDIHTVSFEIQWDFSVDGELVRFVLVFARTENGDRSFLGKSFDKAHWADKCVWHQSDEVIKSTRLTIELQSVSWAGQSSFDVCQLHLES